MRLWGLTEIAEYYAVRRQNARKWAEHSAFPLPYEVLAQGRVWIPAEVIDWGDRHGRRKGGGPGTPKGAAASAK